MANMREWVVEEHAQALNTVYARLAEDDPARGILLAALRACDCEGGRSPQHSWIELR